MSGPTTFQIAPDTIAKPPADGGAVLRDVWRQVLDLEELSESDNFFMLGGDSLQVTRMLGLLREQGWSAPLKELMRAPTLSQMAIKLTPFQRKPATPSTTPNQTSNIPQADLALIHSRVPGGAENVQDVYGLLPMQVAFLYQHQRTPVGDPYVVIDQFHCTDQAILERLISAYRCVLARHDILRSVFFADTSSPLQAVLSKVDFPVAYLPQMEDAAQIRARLSEQPMPLDTGPMLRAYAAPDGDGWALFVLKHHIVGDHVSFDLLHDEVANEMGGQSQAPAVVQPFREAVQAFDEATQNAAPPEPFVATQGDAPFGLDLTPVGASPLDEARLEIDPALYARLKQQARAAQVSLGSLCHLAWGLILTRAAGTDTVTTGSVFLGRANLNNGLRTIMGPMINTLPLQMEINDQPVRATLNALHQQLTDMLAHEHLQSAMSGQTADQLPFAALLNFRHSDAGRDTAHLGYQHLLEDERATFPLTCSIDDFGDRLCLTVQVLAQRDAHHIARLLETAFTSLADALEHHPEQATSSLEVLPADEQELVLNRWNDTSVDFPDQRIHQIFQQHAQQTPNALALKTKDREISYHALDQWSDGLAHWMQQAGLADGDHVALCLQNRATLVATQLAASKIGAVYVPVAADLPAPRLAAVLISCAAKGIVTDVANLDVDAPCPVLQVTDAALSANAFAAIKGDGNASAYVMYTSGSTGAPKGVTIAHRGIARLAINNADLPVTPGNRFAFASNPSFDASTFEIWAPLLNGAALVVLESDTLLSPTALAAEVTRSGIDTMWLTAGLFNQVATDLEPVFSQLSTLIIGGDVADRDAVYGVAHNHPTLRFLNGYGPTEVTTFAVIHAITTPGDPTQPPPIGKPMSNTRAYVLDQRMRPVPIGAVGELYLGGPGVALGYLGQPELTAERFLPDTFAPTAGATIYQTGDLVRWLPTGLLEYLGRKDSQVKIRGFRIEPEEVRAALLRHDAVADAVVVAVGDTAAARHLVAYVVPRAGQDILTDALTQHLRDTLPAFMVPQKLALLETLPLTPTGKVDRRALPDVSASAAGPSHKSPPVGPVETKLADILSPLLGVERINRDDDLFDLGAHSLLILKLLSAVRQHYDVDLNPSAPFAAPTVATLALTIDAHHKQGGLAPLDTIPPRDRSKPSRPSPSQQSLWFLTQFDGGNEAYVIPSATILDGDLNLTALQNALQNLFARHEALRSVFSDQDGEVAVKFLPKDTTIPLPIHDMRDQSEQQAITDIMAAQWALPFDLEHGPLIRAQLVRLSDTRHLFVLALHHIIADGWSMEIIAQDLSQLYAAELGHGPAPLPHSIAFQDAADWQAKRLEDGMAAQQSAYWVETLNGADMRPALPIDKPRPTVPDFLAGSVPIAIAADQTQRLETLARANGTTLFTLLLTAWSLVLARLSGRDDLLIAVPVANRDHPDTAHLVGYFANTLAIRVKHAENDQFGTLLRRVHNSLQDGQRHQDLAWEEVVKAVAPPRALDHLPICQVLFGWRNGDDFPLDLDAIAAMPVTTPAERVKFDLHLDLARGTNGVTGSLNYASALFEKETAQRHAAYLTTLLAKLEHGTSDRPLAQLDMMSDEECAALTRGPTPPSHAPKTLKSMLERQCASTPDRVALTDSAQSLTYRQLGERSDQLATALRRHVAGANPVVGIAMQRSIDVVTIIVACAKAGIAYVPLEPSLPQARLASMCDTAAPQMVVCDLSGMQALRNLAAKTILISKDASGAPTLPAANGPAAKVSLTPDSLAYILFTSGSTGAPKGVCVPHRALVNHLTWILRRYTLTTQDVVIHKTPLSFDVSVWEMFWPLINGATVTVLPAEAHKDPDALLSFIENHDVSVAHFVPSMMNALLQSPRAKQLNALRQIFLGGEAVSGALVQTTQAAFPAAQVTNFYGPSECTIESTSWDAPRNFTGTEAPIGAPIDNMAAYVLDPAGRPVPLGATGELYLSGHGVADGYAARPDLTADAFQPDPFNTGARMYRTGDLVRQRSDGNLVFVGRRDGQAKLRGYRVELSEIERVLQNHADVSEAAVTILESPKAGQRLVAHVVLRNDTPLSHKEMQRFARAHLPDYMTPTAFVQHDELPRTVSGKIDRHALPLPGPDDHCTGESAQPETATEIALAAIWSTLLGVQNIGRDDSFFDLGGNSLLAIRVVHEARAAGLPLALADLVSRPVLSLQAAHLDHLHANSNGHSHPSRKSFTPYSVLTTSGTDKPTIIAFPGAGMSSTSFRHFATVASGDFTVVGLDPPGLIPNQVPFDTVEEAATFYADTICDVASRDELHLVGHSFGAIAAFATAQLLLEREVPVTSLSLVDPPHPTWGQKKPTLRQLHQDFAAGLADALSCPIDPALEQVLGRDTADYIVAIREWLVASGALPEGVAAPILNSRFQTYRAARAAPYSPSASYPIATHVFLSDTIGRQSRVAGWTAHLPNITIAALSASHHGMLLPPDVSTLYRLWLDARTTDLSNQHSTPTPRPTRRS